MKRHGFALLNTTQFLGVLNDNLFKLLLIFMLLEQATNSPHTILALAGAIFVLPFLLFSIPAGGLADRYAKNRIVVVIKVLEVAAALVGVVGFYLHSAFGVFAALFLLASSGAVFGPSKYGIVPELVTEDKISKANGYLSSLTYIAIIIGTACAGPLTSLVDRNYPLASLACLVIACLGLFCSFFLPKTKPASATAPIQLRLIPTLRSAYQTKHLLLSIFGSAYFLFIGGYVQLNIIPYAMQCLNLSDLQSSYLFLVTALGIGTGSLIAGKLSKDHVELGLPPLGALGIAICCFILGYCHSLTAACLLLFLVGCCGGIYVVPLDSFIQSASAAALRGQNIAANNFLGFVGVLIASFLIYLMPGPPQTGFLFLALFTAVVTISFFILLREPVFRLFGRRL